MVGQVGFEPTLSQVKSLLQSSFATIPNYERV